MVDGPAIYGIETKMKIPGVGKILKDTGVRFKFEIRISRSERYQFQKTSKDTEPNLLSNKKIH